MVCDAVRMKRKVNESLTEGEEEDDGEGDRGPPCSQKSRTATALDSYSEASPLLISDMKHLILDYFSENLRELIVQSLASKISENNFITDSSSTDHCHDNTMETSDTDGEPP